MSGKLIFLGNLILATLLGLHLFSTYKDLSQEKTIKRKPSRYAFEEVKRPSGGGASDWGRIFHTTRKGSNEKNDPAKVGRDEAGLKGDKAGLNELVKGDEVMRVQGIFITRDQRYAVISITHKKKKNKEEIIKVSVGGEVRGAPVVSIGPASIGLLHPSWGAIYLRIFKDDKL